MREAAWLASKRAKQARERGSEQAGEGTYSGAFRVRRSRSLVCYIAPPARVVDTSLVCQSIDRLSISGVTSIATSQPREIAIDSERARGGNETTTKNRDSETAQKAPPKSAAENLRSFACAPLLLCCCSFLRLRTTSINISPSPLSRPLSLPVPTPLTLFLSSSGWSSW